MRENILEWAVGGSIIIGILLLFLLSGMFGTYETFVYPEQATAATSSTVTVSASVTATISCSTNITSTAFGTLTDAAIATSSPNSSTTMACANSSAGCTLSINDAGGGSPTQPGLWNSTSSALIESPNASFSATTTLAAGTEGYGIRSATTTAGNGAILSVALRYNTGLTQGLAGSVNDVGGLATTTLTLASTTASTSSREVTATHKAAIASNTPGGDYNDTITYSCTAN